MNSPPPEGGGFLPNSDKLIPQEIKDKWFDDMDELCKFFENPDHYQYNNFNYRQALCHGNEEKYSDIVPNSVENQ